MNRNAVIVDENVALTNEADVGNEKEKVKVKIEKWTLTKEAYQKKEDAEKRALNCLKNGETFEPTMEETTYANMKYSIEVYDDEEIPYKNAYELKEKDC